MRERFTKFSLHNLLTVLMLSTLAFMPLTASAFKVETHVWVAQQVINELAKGSTISIRLGTHNIDLPVRKEVRDAILANQELFRLGSLGPDAFPGVFEGQMTIHPGAKDKGWGTGDWLAHVLRSAQTPGELAFAYGFLTHAAADIFAHTYINQYAGDIYLLTDGEVDVEKRHFLLEGYIAQRMPPLLTSDGTPMSTITNLLRQNGNITVPKEFLRRVFVDNGDAAKQFSLNGSPHMTAVYDLNRALRDVTRKGGPLEQLHILTPKLLVNYNTKYKASDNDLKLLNDAHQRLHDINNDTIDRLQAADKQFRDQAIKHLGAAHQKEHDAFLRAQDLLNKIKQLNNEMGGIERDLAKAKDDLDKLVDPTTYIDVNKCEDKILNPCTGTVTGPPGCETIGSCVTSRVPPGCDAVSQVCKTVKELRTIENSLRPKYEQLVKEKQKISDQAIAQLGGYLIDYKTATDQVHATVESILVAEGKIIHDSVDFLQRFTKDADPIKGLLLGWLDDNSKAMDAYFLANATAMSNSIDGGEVLEPLKKWADCSAPSLMGLPSQIVDGSCTIKSTVADIKQAFDRLEELATKQDPVLREVLRIKKEVDHIIKLAEKEALTSFASKVTGIDVENLMNILKVKPTKDIVDAEFVHPVSVKDLVLFNKVTDRVDKEMSLDLKGYFIPEKFNVVYNATVLAKLAMLDADALNVIMGKKVFTPKPLENSNIILRFASSIDGNHQWLQMPPPYARKNGNHHCGSPYGYPNFALWVDKRTRKDIFNGLFKGPLSPGLEIPSSLGLEPALPKNYPYQPTVNDPYPNYIFDVNARDCR